MGTYLNPGNEAFQQSLDSPIYVDKSMLIELVNAAFNTRDRYVCVSRPRRFGKTMAIDMLAAYYGRGCESRSQFQGLAIAESASFEKNLNRYDVICVTMSDFLFRSKGSVDEMIDILETRVMRELGATYPDAPAFDDDSLADRLSQVYAATGIPFVFLIDEWDCVMREKEGDEPAQKVYLDWLRSLLKDKQYVGLAYATGILPVRKYGHHSALNMFDEVSMLSLGSWAEYTGFTRSEVEGLCKSWGMDELETRRWYDGYDAGGVEVYNPRSVVAAMQKGAFGSYWTRTETYEALRRYIALDMDGLRTRITELVAGNEVPLDPSTSQNDMTTFTCVDDVLTLLVHLGYLTYVAQRGTVRVPNSEVAAEFVTSLRTTVGWEEVARSIGESEELMAATLAGDENRVSELVERAHDANSSILRYNDENSLACALAIAYYSARRTHVIEREAPAGKGYADLLFRPRSGQFAPALVVELKCGGSPEDALAQIRSRRYAEALETYREVLLVGIAYDPDSRSDAYKRHSCVIQRLER